MGKQKMNQAETPKKNSKFLLVANLSILIFINFGFGFFAVKYGLNRLTSRVYEIVPQFQSKAWNSETQTEVLITFLFAVGVYLLSNALIAMTIRVLTSSNPIKDKDPLYLGVANRILSNTVEQVLVFGPIYAYFVYYVSEQSEKDLAIYLALQFVVGRILFAVGYYAGMPINLPLFRGMGMVFTLTASKILVARIYLGVNWLTTFNEFLPYPLPSQ